MPDNTIDTLNIVVESDSSSAARAVDKLARKLGNLDSALGGLNTRGLRNYAREMGRITSAFNSLNNIRTSGLDNAISKLNTLSKINLSNLQNLNISVGLDIKGGDQTTKLQYAIDKTIRDIKVDTSSLSDQIVSAFNLKGGAASKVRAQMNELAKEMAQSYGNTEVSDKLNGTLESIGNTILKSGSVVKGELGSYFSGVEQEWSDFYNFFKNKKIYVSDMLKADVGKGEFNSLLRDNLSKIVTDATKGINLDKSWAELSDRFPTLIPKDTINAADQLITVLENIKRVRDSIKPISIQELSGVQATQASDKVWGVSADVYNQLAQKVGERIQNTLKDTSGQLPIDVKINTDKITLDIQKAINKAAELKYNAVKVTLDVDVSQVKDSVSKKLKEIDAGQMDNLANGMKNFSSSLSGLASIDFKSSGLNSIINSLSRLSKVKMSDFDTERFRELIASLSEISNIPDISSGVNRFISSIAKLSSTGESIKTVSSELPKLGSNLKTAAERINSIGEISESVNLFVQSLGRLATAGNKTSQTASQLSVLSRELLNFFNVMKDAPTINSDTVRMTEALAQLASAGGKVGTASSSVTNAFNNINTSSSRVGTAIGGMAKAFSFFASKVVSLSRRVISSIAKIGSTALQTSKNFSGFSGIFTAISNKINSLYMRLFFLKRVTSTLFQPVEQAVNYVETLNYFNSAFQQVAENVNTDEWKKSGIKSAEAYANSFQERAKQLTQKLTGFNISDTGELTRTNIPSMGLDPEKTMQYQATFAQMASSMGDTSETALKLSDALTMVGADLASVRNMDFEDVWQDMASGLTGMSRAMDKYGINIRNANMQQELYNLGINTSISNLTQADKTILRTIILLNNSQYAWADLADTINQPANQIRMLQSNFSSLARTIGSLFIPILQTVLPYINAVTIALQRMFAYIAKVLGIKLSDYVSSTGGISVDTSNIADDMENTSDAIDTANDNAQKLKKTLSVMAFDELNQQNDASVTSGSGASSGSSNKGGNAHLPQLDAALDEALGNYQRAWEEAYKNMSNRANEMADAIVNAFKSKDWYGLGEIMASGINWGMQKIYDAIKWENVGPKITAFTSAFTTAFNSLIKNTNFPLIGQTIGAGITTIVRSFNLLTDPSTGIDFDGLGSKISQGFRGMIGEIPWTEFGNALGNKFMIAWRLFDGFVKDMSAKNDAGMTGWQQLGDAIAKALNGIFKKVDFGKIADSLATGLNGAFDSLSEFTQKFNWDDLVDNITTGISTFIQNFNWRENGKKLEDFLNHLLTALVDIAENVNWEAFGHNIGVFLSQIDWPKHIKQLLTVLTDVLGGIWEGLGTTSAGTFVKVIATFSIGSKLMPFINSISKFFTGSSATGLLSKAVQGMLGTGFETLSATTIPIFGETLGALVGTAGPIALATIGAVKLAKGLAGVTEAMQGGNGMTTQYGGYLHDYATELSTVAQLTNEQSEALWKLIEKDEELGKSHDDMYSDMIEKLQEYGVSADQAKVALESYGAQAGVSAEFVEGMTDKIKTLGNGASEAAEKFDTSKISMSDLRSVLQELSISSSEFGGNYTSAMWALDDNKGSLTSTKDALDLVYKSLKDAGVPLDELDKKLREDFPDATMSTKTAVDKNIVGAQQTISSSVKKASSDTKAATNSMADTATSDFAEIQSKADEYLNGVNTSTVTQWGNSSAEVSRNLRQMKIDVSTGLGYIDKTVTSHFSSQYNIMTTKWKNAVERISGRGQIIDTLDSALSRKIPAMSKYFDQLSRNILKSLNGLYEVGRNAAQQLANGLQSVHIKTPHIYMNSSAWANGNGYSYRWDSGVNWYKRGGLFDSASVIGVGEAGKEAVLPLENPRAMKSIADSIMDSSKGMGLTKDELIQAVAQGVSMAMMNNSSSGTPQYIMNSISLDSREIAKAVTKAQNAEKSRFNPSPAY